MSAPESLAYQALIAKLVDLADERGCRVTDVAIPRELSKAAESLMTRKELDEFIKAEVERVANEVLDEKVASGEWTVTDGIIRRKSLAS